jgi:hypothetical protein
MRHEQCCLRILLPKIQQQLIHLVAGDRIERAERLVHQQKFGIVHERAADRDALAHPTRQFVRLLVHEAVEADPLQQQLRTRAIGIQRPLQDTEREQHVVERALPR